MKKITTNYNTNLKKVKKVWHFGYERDGVRIFDLNYHIFLRFYFLVFSLVLGLNEQANQTLKTVFDHISKHLELRQKFSAKSRIFNSLLSIWRCDQARSFVFYRLLRQFV